jgi:hypothetical protein
MQSRILTVIAIVLLMSGMPFDVSAEEPFTPRFDIKKPIPGQPSPGLPPLPDLIISGGLKLRLPPFILGDRIKIPVQIRIENRGAAASGPFQIAFFRLVDAPPGAIEEVEFDGAKLFSGIRPTRDGGGDGVSFYSVMGNAIVPIAMAGQKIKICTVVDSERQVRELDETHNKTPWLEVQLPVR